MNAKNLLPLAAAAVLLAGCAPRQNMKESQMYPRPNMYLSAPVYGVSHFNPAQNDAFPYKVDTGTFQVDLNRMPMIYSGPINIMTMASTNENYMWGASTDRVAYIDCKDGKWESVAEMGLPGVPMISTEGLKQLVDTPYTTVAEADTLAKRILGPVPQAVTYNGIYTLVDHDNNIYINSGNTICVFGLKDRENPAAGIELKRQLETKDIFTPLALLGMPAAVRLIGINMTYDGYLIIGSATGIAVIDREFKNKAAVYNIEAGQLISNSLTVDEKNGIYVASGSLEPRRDGILRRLVWTGSEISDKESDGAWSSPYEGGDWPPAIKAGTGTGATPTLMGYDDNQDKLVVITDGANRMNIVAFWREDIPKNFEQIPGTKSRRIAGQMPVTAGRPASQEWIQSEQSVAVCGWGAFVVNNVTPEGLPDKMIDAMSLGILINPPMGCERFEWDHKNHKWNSVWTRGDAVSISTVPVVSSESGIVFINGYTKEEGWSMKGLDWNTGKTVTNIVFGQNNRGNGAYAIEQFMPNGDLLLNSIVGTARVPLMKSK